MHVSVDTRSRYTTRGYGIRLGWGRRPALIVIDFQRALTEASSQYGHDYDEEIAATVELLSEARRAAIPITHTVIGYSPGSLDANIMLQKIPGMKDFIFGTETTEIDSRVTPLPNEYVIEKRVQSAFFGTMLSTFLTMRAVDTLVVAGCTTSGCVRATVTDAAAYGYRSMVVAEAVGDIAQEPHECSLFDLQAKVADVVPLDEALAEIRQRPAPAVQDQVPFPATGT